MSNKLLFRLPLELATLESSSPKSTFSRSNTSSMERSRSGLSVPLQISISLSKLNKQLLTFNMDTNFKFSYCFVGVRIKPDKGSLKNSLLIKLDIICQYLRFSCRSYFTTCFSAPIQYRHSVEWNLKRIIKSTARNRKSLIYHYEVNDWFSLEIKKLPVVNSLSYY